MFSPPKKQCVHGCVCMNTIHSLGLTNQYAAYFPHPHACFQIHSLDIIFCSFSGTNSNKLFSLSFPFASLREQMTKRIVSLTENGKGLHMEWYSGKPELTGVAILRRGLLQCSESEWHKPCHILLQWPSILFLPFLRKGEGSQAWVLEPQGFLFVTLFSDSLLQCHNRLNSRSSQSQRWLCFPLMKSLWSARPLGTLNWCQ